MTPTQAVFEVLKHDSDGLILPIQSCLTAFFYLKFVLRFQQLKQGRVMFVLLPGQGTKKASPGVTNAASDAEFALP